MLEETYDWRKAAAMASSDSPSAEEVEMAFMDLAYSYISQKAGPLLDDPHRLGFEVVYSNDDNTRMAAMAAFRVGKHLLSVPCFFLDGSVKGTELLYQHRRKLFCPLTDEWTRHLVARYRTENEGQGQSKEMTNKVNPGMRLERLAQPNFMKRASDDNKHLWKEAFEAIEAHATSPDTGAPQPVLSDFLRHTEGAMTKLAAAIESSFDFATAIAHLPEEDWDVEPEVVKSATSTEPDLVVYYDNFDSIKSASATHEGFKQGWYVLDTRPETDLNVVMAKSESEFSEISEPGYHDIICADGKIRRVFLSKPHCPKPREGRYNQPVAYYPHSDCKNILIFSDNNEYCASYGTVFGTPADDCVNGYEDLPSTPEKGGCVVFNCKTGASSQPIYIIKTTKRSDGVTLITFKESHSNTEKIAYLNPEAEVTSFPDDCSCGEPITFGACCKFLKVNMEKCEYNDESYRTKDCNIHPGTMEHYWQFLAQNGVQPASLTKNEEDMDGNKYTIQAGEVKADAIDGAQAVVKMAHAFHISATDATELVHAANKSGSVEFLVLMEKGLTKVATQIRIIDSPDFREEYDQSLNVKMENPQTFALRSETDQPIPPARRLGDAYNPNPPEQHLVSRDARKAGLTDNDILGGSPEALAQFASQSGNRNLVDHGVVGMLINTYDASSMVAKYIPRLEEGLDHFGRLIFLFHWKPADFEKLYGSDDMSNIESNLISQFISFGDILLELIKRNDDIDGSAQM